jgi:hypothetical protein
MILLYWQPAYNWQLFCGMLAFFKTYAMKYVFVLLTLCALGAHAQDKTVQNLRSESNRAINKQADTAKKTWRTGGAFNLNVNQGALSNWSAGGDKFSLSLTSLLNLFAHYQHGRHSWDNVFDFAYGMVNTTSLGQRKSDDRIDLLSKYGYELDKKWYLSSLINFRSQFAKGFSYPNDSTKILTSNFLAPAYLVYSIGMDYKPDPTFSMFMSPITARWVIVGNDSLSAAGAYGVDSGKHVKMELGAYASINWNKNITPTTNYKTKLDLFSNYRHDPFNIDIFWTNVFTVKVTRLINMNLSVDLLYDNDVKRVKDDGSQGGATAQIKELLGVGFVLKF